MSPKIGKTGNKRAKGLQPRISDYGSVRNNSELSPEANDTDDEAAGNAAEQTMSTEILEAIKDLKAELKADFSKSIDGILAAINGVRQDISESAERIANAEARISTVEDDVVSLQAKVRLLEEKKKVLEDKVMDLEARSRRSNLRLIGLPEKEEGEDACMFLEKWIPEILELAAASTISLERAHRVGQRREPGAPPRTVIIKFLNEREKAAVLRAARNKKDILYKDHPIRFFPDLAAGVHQKQKEFDMVRQKLRSMGIRHGMLVPARLVLTYKGRTQIFGKLSEAEAFVNQIQEEDG